MKPSGIGGQAAIEGIMMRNKDKYSIAVRRPDNEIEVVVKESRQLSEKFKILKLPIIRGIVVFLDSLVTGISVINYSASFYDDPAEQKRTKADDIGKAVFNDKFEAILMAVTVLFSILFAIGLFMILPYFISRMVSKYVVFETLLNFIEGLIRLIIFIIYISLISLMKDIRRTFMYHGAEHKCINCVENGARLTPANVKNSSRYHKRCGTSFLFIVMFISIVFFIFIRVKNTALQVVVRLLLIPVIAGVSYEVIRLAGRKDNLFTRIISKPGMWFQSLTTREPDMDMIEVAIKAVEEVFDWRAFLIEYYEGEEDPEAAMLAAETELTLSNSVINEKKRSRSIKVNKDEPEIKAVEDMTAEERYIHRGREFGMDELERERFASNYETSDESESNIYDSDNSAADNSENERYEMSEDYDLDSMEGFDFIDTPGYDDNNESAASLNEDKVYSEDEVVAGFQFAEVEAGPEEIVGDDVPVFKKRR